MLSMVSQLGIQRSARLGVHSISCNHRLTLLCTTSAPSTFSQQPQRLYTPAVPSRLRTTAASTHQSPSLARSSSGTPQPPASHSYVAPPEPVHYPPGPYPLAATPPGLQSRGVYSRRPLSQAKFTTYESRMKTGVTTLIQPINITGGPNAAFAHISSSSGLGTGGSSTPVVVEGRRRATRVNYAEDDAYEGMEDDDEHHHVGPGRPRKSAQSRRGGGGAGEDSQAGWSWLGERTPAERVVTSTASPTVLPFV